MTTTVVPPHTINPKDCHFTNTSINTSDWHYSCNENYYNFNDIIFLILAVVSNMILIALSRRENTSTRWGRCCGGHPGTLFPLNMLDGYEHRLAYCAAFGSMTFELASILWNPYGRFTSFGIGHLVKDDPVISNYPVLRLVLLLFQVGVCTFMFYPYFLALATSYKFVGAVIGVVLSLDKFASWLWMSTCADTELDILSAGFKVKKHMLAILLWPCIICMAVLLWQYISIIIRCVRSRTYGESKIPTPIALPHHIEHVKYLLGKQPLPWAEQNLHHVSMFNKEKFLANFRFSHLPGFKFPTRVMATFVVTVLALYQIGTRVAFQVYSGLKVIRRVVRCTQQVIPADLAPFAAMLEPYSKYIMKYANIMANLWIVTMVFNCVLAIFYVYHICLCYRKHTLRIYRGERSIFPRNWIRENNHNILTSASRHAGLQIAYTIWGFVIIQSMLFLMMAVLIFLIVIPIIDFGYWKIVDYILQVVVFTLILNLLIYWLQVLINRFMFLQGKINPTDEKPPLAIDNRKGWYNVSFFFFFWNLFLGIISALMRIVKGLILGIFFIPRIDRPVLMRGFETMDNGFYAYLCLLSVINAHDHPVVKVFVKCLVDGLEESRCRESRMTEFNGFDPENAGDSLRRRRKSTLNGNTVQGTKRAKYYWCLAYTLINNPDLLNHRKIEVDEVDSSTNPRTSALDERVRKHKIVLAIHRKKQGEKTSQLYQSANAIEL